MTEREAFEAWCKSKGAPKENWWVRQLDDGGYSCEPVDKAWEAWQARAQTAQAGPQWQPVSTAPKDGTPILVFHHRMVLEAWYSTQWGRFVVSETGGTNGIDPAHWMPLPPPPIVGKEGA